VKGVVRTQYVMRYVDVAVGTGAEAAPGKTYVVHYTGWLTDGRKFDSSRDRNEPLRFEQGRRRVIPGWDAGFEGMRVGGRRRLFIPYQLAYGVPGRSPTIPPCAELIFDIELLGIEEPPPPTASAPPRPTNPADSTRSCPR
jgi:peptidylprolyl isomerase